VPPRLDLEPHRVPEVGGQLPARRMPHAQVRVHVDLGVALAVGRRQAAAGADRAHLRPDPAREVAARPGHALEVRHIDTGADVHVHAGDGESVAGGPSDAGLELGVPDAVLRVRPAGVGLAAVAVAEAGIDAQRDLAAGRPLPVLVDQVGRAAVDRDAALHYQLEGLAVEDVGGVHDRRRIALDGEAG